MISPVNDQSSHEEAAPKKRAIFCRPRFDPDMAEEEKSAEAHRMAEEIMKFMMKGHKRQSSE